MEGKVVGIDGKLGSEVTAAGNGGMLRDGGSVGMLVAGKLGSGGIVSLGRDGIVGNGGRFPCGNVGIEGNGGNVVGFGKVGILGKFGCVVVCKRWRASKVVVLEIVTTRSKAIMKDLLEAILMV
ncbi:hypothetical protein P8452_38612 [Trifolium repens]|jgi:hypothetical protein|nr:hypothetical protein P8452_38612 [Trifolium repens]